MSKVSRPTRALARLSEAILYVELRATTGLLAALMIFILTNVATRYGGMPLYWIDELAVFTMVWLAFVGTSAMSRLKLDFAISFLGDNLPGAFSRSVRGAAIVLIIAFGAALLWMSWIWLDPPGIVAAGFDGRVLAGATFNFLYTEYTQTLGWPRWAVMMIVPIFGLSIIIHGTANLLEELGLSEPPVRALKLGTAEEAH